MYLLFFDIYIKGLNVQEAYYYGNTILHVGYYQTTNNIDELVNALNMNEIYDAVCKAINNQLIK
jgi:hypothetical protein